MLNGIIMLLGLIMVITLGGGVLLAGYLAMMDLFDEIRWNKFRD